jgi:hypothetical protein
MYLTTAQDSFTNHYNALLMLVGALSADLWYALHDKMGCKDAL